MAEFRLLLIAALLWGASVLADRPSANDTLEQDKTSINFKIGYMNATTPDLDLKARVQATDVKSANQILGDLNELYFGLLGEETVEPHSLTTLTCNRALCFGDSE